MNAFRLPLLLLLATCCLNGPALRAADQPPPAPAGPPAAPPRFADLFQPFRTDNAALSPDGRYLAYSMRDGGSLSVVVIEVAHPQVATARVIVATDDTSTPMMATTGEKTPAQILWMNWVTPTRLVVETNTNYAYSSGTQWLSCPGVILAFDFDGKNAKTLVTPRDVAGHAPPSPVGMASNSSAQSVTGTPHPPADGNDTTADPPPSGQVPLTPHIINYVPGDPASLLVETDGVIRFDGMADYGVFKMNIDTGATHLLDDELVEPNRLPYFDRQGKLRIVLPDTTATAFPHRFEYEGGSFWKAAPNLDRLAGFTAAAGFQVSPENYFGARAVPLGFDENPDIFYFASNIGRDTYGIYSLNLKTGKRDGLAVQNPAFDLISPLPDALPATGLLTPDSIQQAALASLSVNNAASRLANPDGSTDGANTGTPDGETQSYDPTARATTDPRIRPLPPASNTLVFDPYTRHLAGVRYEGVLRTARWLNPAWQTVQDELEAALPGQSVEIQQWDRAGNLFLVLAHSPADPGAYYLFDRATAKLAEYARRAPWLDEASEPRSFPFALPDPAGGQITGVLSAPRVMKVRSLPLIVLCPTLPWERVSPDYQPAVQAFTRMGFAVLQLNARGAWGFGLKKRAAIQDGYEQAQIADIVAAIAGLAPRFSINVRRVALVGAAQGGYVALRALQLHPESFRCAVALNTAVDLAGWLADVRWTSAAAGPALISAYLGDAAHLQAAPLIRRPESVVDPVLLLNYPGPLGAPRQQPYLDAKHFVAAAERHGTPAVFGDLSEDYMQDLPEARAAVFRRIEDFLNLHIYDYTVKLGVPVRADD